MKTNELIIVTAASCRLKKKIQTHIKKTQTNINLHSFTVTLFIRSGCNYVYYIYSEFSYGRYDHSTKFQILTLK